MSQSSRTRELEARAPAVEQRRLWVRLTYSCNNRCAFCLDAGRHERGHRPFQEIKAEIEKGRAEGAQRLILSGGEPTIHPGFLDLVRLGSDLGFERVQAISNGRMFAYEGFAQDAVRAGLDEVTVSVHGHEPGLHDRLTGVPGSFEQATAGIRNLLATGMCHVSVDVVVNRMNVAHLDEILENMRSLGVNEFDVLQVMPFGRGNDPQILYGPNDPPGAMKAVRKALANAIRHKAFVWTNRFPAPWLEGLEHLVQDPSKIRDEVRGRRLQLELWAGQGIPLPCRDSRCSHCFLKGLCDYIEACRTYVQSRVVQGTLVVRLAELGVKGAAERLGLFKRVDVLRFEGVTPEHVSALWRAASLETESVQVQPLAGMTRELAARFVRALPGQVNVELRVKTLQEAIAAREVCGNGAAVSLELSGRTIHEVGSSGAWPEGVEAFLGPVPGIKSLSESGPDLETMKKVPGLTRVHGLPPCLGGPGGRPGYTLDLAAVSASGPDTPGLDLDELVDLYLGQEYTVKSFRCDRCVHHRVCRGFHVQFARLFGLAMLKPVTRE